MQKEASSKQTLHTYLYRNNHLLYISRMYLRLLFMHFLGVLLYFSGFGLPKVQCLFPCLLIG